MQWICLKPKAHAKQGNPNPESGILEFFMEEFGILGFGIRNPKRRIQNPGLSWIPLNEATEKATLSSQISRNWNSLMTLYLCLGSVNSSEGGFQRDVNKQGHPTTVFSRISVRRTKNSNEGAFRRDVNKQGHPTTVFSQISVWRTKNCLEFSIA